MTKRLLDQESKLIRKIESLKSAASEGWKLEKLENIMEQMALSKEWNVQDGVSISVDTPKIVMAREMKDIFVELKNADSCE